jgi:hypothetical protein
MDPLPALVGGLEDGLWAGVVGSDPRDGRRGRTRRWSYAAAGAPDVAVGAAVVDLGIASTAFAWCLADDQLLTWEAKGIPRLSARVGTTSATSAGFRGRGARVAIGPDGALRVDVPVDGGRLTAHVDVDADQPAVCVTPTPGGGWNVTQKAAGERARIHVTTPTSQFAVRGGTWRDWTLGAQDRDTTWRWAAGAGHADDGRRVGLNVSTGMNELVGEDVVWWDGVPYPLDVRVLAPTGDRFAGDWEVAGPGWGITLDSAGARAADEDLWLVRSRYVQPVGTFTGTLPDPDGMAVPVTLVGVTEDHAARW